MSDRYHIAHGDVLAVLRQLPSNRFDGLLCDPPYGYRFMGKAWDYDVPSVDVWREALRVLKPGAPLLSFGGSRTYHRIAVGIEDAGFELRDCLHWLYGKGFPKSQNVALAIDNAAGVTREAVGTRTLTGNAAISTKEKGGTYGVQVGSIPAKEVDVTAAATPLAKAWDGYGTALKPAYEPVALARKPLDGTMAENVARWGVGGLGIDVCRIDSAGNVRWATPRGGIWRTNANANAKAQLLEAGGRWPANLILDDEAGAMLDASVAPTTSVPYRANEAGGAVLPLERRTAGGYSDSGGPSRFFYCAKVSTKEREYGCETLPKRSAGEVTGDREEGSAGLSSPRAGAGRSGGARNHHPTLKSIALTKWLATLIKPPSAYTGATLLVPYSGAGSEVIGALLAGWPRVFGIEGEAEYLPIANARIAAWLKKEGIAA